MAKTMRIAQHSWVGGMLNEDLMGRQDLAKYFQGATEITNFVVRRQGCLMKRGGTDVVAAIADGNSNTRMIPFVYDRKTGACIVMTNERFAVYPEGAFGEYKVTRKVRIRQKWFVSSSTPANTGGLQQFMSDSEWLETFPSNNMTSYKDTTVYDLDEASWMDGSKSIDELLEVQPGALPDKQAIPDFIIAAGANTTAWYDALTPIAQDSEMTVPDGWTHIPELSATGAFFNKQRYSTSRGYLERVVELTFEQFTNEGGEFDWRVRDDLFAAGFIGEMFGVNPTPESVISNVMGLGYRTVAEDFQINGVVSGGRISAKTGFCFFTDVVILEKAEVPDYSDATPYKAEDLAELRHCQSGDTIFLTHPKHPIARLYRNSSNRFVYETLPLNLRLPDGPGSVSGSHYTPIPPSSGGAREIRYAVTQVVDGRESQPTKSAVINIDHFPWAPGGYVTLTISNRNPDATELRIYRDEGFGMGLIRIVDPVTSFKDIYVAADYSQEPPRNPDPVFDSAGGYPSCASIYQQRLIFANTLLNPNRYWMSNAGDLYTFSTKRTITEDDAIIASLPLLKGPKILHLVTGKDLLAFTESCEVLIKPNSGNSLSYKTVSAEIQSYTGCSERLQPIVCEAAVLFADRAGQSVREFKYNYSTDTMQGLDVSVLSSGLFASKQIVDWCYQQFPDSNLLCVLSDGTLAVMTYMPDQEVYAWSRFEIDGFKVTACCCSEALVKHRHDLYDASLPSTSETFLFGYDTPSNRWLVLKLRPYGVTEKNNSNYSYTAMCADLVEYSPDGFVIGSRPIVSRMVSVYPDVQEGGMVERDKRVVSVTVRVKGSQGLSIWPMGADDTVDHSVHDMEAEVDNGKILLQEGLRTITAQSDWARDGRVVVEHSGQYGCMVMSLTTELEVH